MCKRSPLPSEKIKERVFLPHSFREEGPRGGGEGKVLLGILGKGLPPSSPNPDTISDQNKS